MGGCKASALRGLAYNLPSPIPGHELPDDDAGRGDLLLLVYNCSLAAHEPKKKMRHVIDLWAPWMAPDYKSVKVILIRSTSGIKAEEKTAIKKPVKKAREILAVQVDPRMVEAIDTLAERQYRTRSDVVRQGILRELEACGVCPVAA